MQLSGTTPPTSQKSGVRPISFLLDNAGEISGPITLRIRPEELTRTEPMRASVHQTMGRDVTGWVDHFGEGLPSVSISGHTGWRYLDATGTDGAGAFAELNQMVAHDFPAAKQQAIDMGMDPADVKLIFVDTLDEFAWSVVPTGFSLRRNKTSPLLIRYNINLQAVDTAVDSPPVEVPFFGSVPSGIAAIDVAVAELDADVPSVDGLSFSALSQISSLLAPLSSSFQGFASMSSDVFSEVGGVVSGGRGLSTTDSNTYVATARDVASAGRNVFRALSQAEVLSQIRRASLSRLASTYNEIACILSNSLRPRTVYEQYEGLYGASNCSSTTGGRQPSAYRGVNTFAAIFEGRHKAAATAAAMASLKALVRMDPVLSPMPMQEITRHIAVVVERLQA